MIGEGSGQGVLPTGKAESVLENSMNEERGTGTSSSGKPHLK